MAITIYIFFQAYKFLPKRIYIRAWDIVLKHVIY